MLLFLQCRCDDVEEAQLGVREGEEQRANSTADNFVVLLEGAPVPHEVVMDRGVRGFSSLHDASNHPESFVIPLALVTVTSAEYMART